MSWLASLLGARFWVLAYALIALALLLPLDARALQPYIPVLLGGVLFFTCLRVELRDVAGQFSSAPALPRLTVLVLLQIVVLPVLVFVLAQLLVPDWSMGLLLVAAMPAGMSSAAFTEVHRGNVALALVLMLVTSLLSPLTVPGLLELGSRVQGSTQAQIAVGALVSRAGFIAVVLALPFTAAQVVRRAAPLWVARNSTRFTPLALFFLACIVFVATSATRAEWLQLGALGLLAPLATVTLASCAFLFASGLVSRRVPGPDAIAFGCGAVYMNNGLAVAFALQFFPGRPTMVMPCILMTVPMVWVVGMVRPLTRRAGAGLVSGAPDR